MATVRSRTIPETVLHEIECGIRAHQRALRNLRAIRTQMREAMGGDPVVEHHTAIALHYRIRRADGLAVLELELADLRDVLERMVGWRGDVGDDDLAELEDRLEERAAAATFGENVQRCYLEHLAELRLDLRCGLVPDDGLDVLVSRLEEALHEAGDPCG